MPRIQPVAPENAQAHTAELYGQVRTQLGRVPNLMSTLGHSPAALGGYLALNGALAKGELSAQDRERVALAVSEHNGCVYCVAAHCAIGKMVGLSADEIDDGRRSESNDPRAEALLRFTRRVLETRGHVDDEDLDHFRSAGYTDAAIAEVIAHVALSTLTNYFNSIAGTEVDFPAAKELVA